MANYIERIVVRANEAICFGQKFLMPSIQFPWKIQAHDKRTHKTHKTNKPIAKMQRSFIALHWTWSCSWNCCWRAIEQTTRKCNWRKLRRKNSRQNHPLKLYKYCSEPCIRLLRRRDCQQITIKSLTIIVVSPLVSGCWITAQYFVYMCDREHLTSLRYSKIVWKNKHCSRTNYQSCCVGSAGSIVRYSQQQQKAWANFERNLLCSKFDGTTQIYWTLQKCGRCTWSKRSQCS